MAEWVKGTWIYKHVILLDLPFFHFCMLYNNHSEILSFIFVSLVVARIYSLTKGISTDIVESQVVIVVFAFLCW